jgi:hypothetical protein
MKKQWMARLGWIIHFIVTVNIICPALPAVEGPRIDQAQEIKVAVTPRGYDDIGKVIEGMNLPNVKIVTVDDKELANYDYIRQFAAIFINCSGAAYSNAPAAASALERFVREGGTLYASDWAFVYILKAFPGYITFYGDPYEGEGDAYIGNAGHVDANIVDAKLADYVGKTKVDIYYNLPSWVPIKDIPPTAVALLKGNIDIEYIPSKGIIRKSAPPKHRLSLASGRGRLTVENSILACWFTYGKGKVIYTTFHNEPQISEFVERILNFYVFEALNIFQSYLLVDKSQAYSSDTLYYNLIIQNRSDNMIPNINAVVQVPEEAIYVPNSGVPSPTIDGQKLVWWLEQLKPGEKVTITFALKPKISSGKIAIKARISAFGIADFETNIATTEIIVPPPSPAPTTVEWDLGVSSLFGPYGEAAAKKFNNYGFALLHAYLVLEGGGSLGYELLGTGDNTKLIIKRRFRADVSGGVDIIKITTPWAKVKSAGLEGKCQYIIGRDYEFTPFINDDDAIAAAALIITDAAMLGVSLLPATGPFMAALMEALIDYKFDFNAYRDKDHKEVVISGSAGALQVEALLDSLKVSSQPGGIQGNLLLRFYHWEDYRLSDDEAKQAKGFDISLEGGLSIPDIGLFLKGVPTGVGGSGQGSLGIESRFNNREELKEVVVKREWDSTFNLSPFEWHYIDETQLHLPRQLIDKIRTINPNHPLSEISESKLAQLQIVLTPLQNLIYQINSILIDSEMEIGQLHTFKKSQVITKIDVGLDIGASLGLGGGIKIGFSGYAMCGKKHLNMTSNLKVSNRELIETDVQKFTPVPSNWEGTLGIIEFNKKLFSKAFNIIKDKIKSLFYFAKEKIEDATKKIVNAAKGKASVVVDGVKWIGQGLKGAWVKITSWKPSLPFFSPKSRMPLPIELRPYSTSKVVLLKTRQLDQHSTMTVVGMIHRIEAETFDGVPLINFPRDSLQLEITVSPDMLTEIGFSVTDINKIRLFRYNPKDDAWYELPSNLTKSKATNEEVIISSYVDSPGDYAAGVIGAPLDNSGPNINILSPTDGSKTGPRPLIRILLTDESGVDTSTLKIIIDTFELSNITMDFISEGMLVTTVPSEEIKPGEHILTVQVEDVLGNQNRSSVKFHVVKGLTGLPTKGVSIVSVPYDPVDKNPESIWRSKEAKFALWTGQGYEIYPASGKEVSIAIGQALWAKFKSDPEVDLMGVFADVSKPFHIALRTGWNLVGMPFLDPIVWHQDAVRVKFNGTELTLAQAQQAGWIEDYAWGWE